MFVAPKPMGGKGLVCAFCAEISASPIRFSDADDMSLFFVSIVKLVNVPLSSSIGSRIVDLESISV